jgi:Transient receptor potential (TRP) ion channel
MSILCLWQLVERDSAAEIVLALVIFLSMSGALAWASYKIISLARKSLTMHKNPAYILYSDPLCLNKWGFLYVQYKANAYYFVVAILGYILFKAIFIAFAQSSPVAQAAGLLVIEAVALIALCVLKPFIDKKTNIFNIAIGVINFLNAIFLLIFSDVFGQPAMVSGIMGVIFAMYNMIFAFVLLIMVLVSSAYAITSKNPETRYQPIRDDRGSFIKSQQQLTTELDALGATARGDGKEPHGQAKNIDDSEFMSTGSLQKPPHELNEKNAYDFAHEQHMYPAVIGHRIPDACAQRQTHNQSNNDSGDFGYGAPRPSIAPQHSSYDRSLIPPNGYAQPP